MRQRIGRNDAVFYDDIQEMPMDMYMKYQLFVMMDSAIGADIQSIENHLSIIERFNAKGEKEKVQKQTANLRQSMYFVTENVSPKMMSFVTLLKEWNGKKVRVITDEEAKEWSDKIAKDISYRNLATWLDEIKKNWTQKLKRFFRSFQIQSKRSTSTAS